MLPAFSSHSPWRVLFQFLALVGKWSEIPKHMSPMLSKQIIVACVICCTHASGIDGVCICYLCSIGGCLWRPINNAGAAAAVHMVRVSC